MGEVNHKDRTKNQIIRIGNEFCLAQNSFHLLSDFQSEPIACLYPPPFLLCTDERPCASRILPEQAPSYNEEKAVKTQAIYSFEKGSIFPLFSQQTHFQNFTKPVNMAKKTECMTTLLTTPQK